jgi:hypothetical protein
VRDSGGADDTFSSMDGGAGAGYDDGGSLLPELGLWAMRLCLLWIGMEKAGAVRAIYTPGPLVPVDKEARD